MLPNWNDMGAAEERRRDLLRAAEAERRAAPAAAGPRPARLHARALARLGRILVAWGSRLEAMGAAR